MNEEPFIKPVSIIYKKSKFSSLACLKFRLKYKFNMTVKSYFSMLEDQDGVCKICKKLCVKNQRLSVDHCHKTGKIRGLLCHNCNSGLGYFKDSIKSLEEAAKYLKN